MAFLLIFRKKAQACAGIEIECVENRAEAVEMFRAAPERYQTIFKDVQMPVVCMVVRAKLRRYLG